MNPENKHTPTPWRWRSLTDKNYPPNYDLDTIYGADGTAVLTLYANNKRKPDANFTHIVHCVNTHASLVAENERLREALESLCSAFATTNRDCEEWKQYREAIAALNPEGTT